MQIISSHTI